MPGTCRLNDAELGNLDAGSRGAKSRVVTGKPVFVAWTPHEDRSGRLRSGETIAQAMGALEDLSINGFLVHCCALESITRAMPNLAATGARYVGGYANTSEPIPEDWTLDGEMELASCPIPESDTRPMC